METLKPGDRVSRFVVIRPLGAGGMGEVYEAKDESLDRSVAIKILPPDLVANPDRLRRFTQEAKSASSLSHPHIVAIFEIGESAAADGATVHYMAMELVSGVTLREKIHDEKAPMKSVLRWMAQVADALAKAHSAGIVHRDLKPDNVMISADGWAKVLDFGLAKLTQVDSGDSVATTVRDKTADGVVVGTVGYMSPEQVSGRAVDARSDIFSLGCMLYEAATGMRPFRGDTSVDVLHSILHDTPHPVGELNPKVPSEVRRLIKRCLAKDPGERYQSMKDLALELGELAEEYDQLAFRSSSGSSGSGAMQAVLPRRNTAAILLGALLLASLACIGYLVTRGRAAGEPGAAPARVFAGPVEQITFEGGQEEEPAVSPDGKFVAYVRQDGGDSDIFLIRIGGQNAINLTASCSDDDGEPAFSPDGETIVFHSNRDGGGIFLMGATGESVRRLTNEGHDPAFSPDGKTIAFATERPVGPEARQGKSALKTVDVASGTIKPLYEGDAVQPRFSPDGKRIVFWQVVTGKGQRDIASVPIAGGAATKITDDPALDWSPVWSPDGNWVWFSSNRGGAMNLCRIRVDEATGKPSGEAEAVTVPFPHVGHAGLSADGRRLVFATRDRQTRIDAYPFDNARGAVTGDPRPVLRGSLGLSAGLDISPDGSTLSLSTSGSTQEDVWTIRTDGSALTRLTSDVFLDRGPTWSADGKQIAFYSNRTGNYEIWTIGADGSGMKQITQVKGATNVWWPSFSPDGRSISTGGSSGSLVLDRGPDGQFSQSRKLPPDPDATKTFNALAWSADSTKLGGTEYDAKTSSMSGIVVLDLTSGAYRHVSNGQWGFLYMRWARDGRWIVAAVKGEVWLFDPNSVVAEKRLLERQPGEAFSGCAISPDGKTLYVVRFRSEGDVWMVDLTK